MRGWLFLVGLGALLSAARAELPIDLPADTPTSRPVSGINVPAPLRTDEPTNTVVVSPPLTRPWVREPLQRTEVSVAGADWLMCTNGDRFPGAFVGYEAGVLHWRIAGQKKTIRLREDGVEGIALAESVTTNSPAPVGWLVFLADGSLLPARHVTVEGGHVAADLSHAGRVRLERAQVARLRRYDGQHTELVTLADAPAYTPAKTPATGGSNGSVIGRRSCRTRCCWSSRGRPTGVRRAGFRHSPANSKTSVRSERRMPCFLRVSAFAWRVPR
jgi:hypothetical protein